MNTLKLMYINEHWNPYLIINEPKEKVYTAMDNKVNLHDGHFVYGVSELGFYSFGYWANQENKRPGHGGLWSSNSGTLGSIIGKEVTEAGVKLEKEGSFFRMAMSIDSLRRILPPEYYIENHPFSDGMSNWKIHHKDDASIDLSAYGWYQYPTREYEFETELLKERPKGNEATESPSEAAAG